MKNFYLLEQFKNLSKESCLVRPIPAYKAGLHGLRENRQLSNSNSKPAFIPVHRTGFSASFNKKIVLSRRVGIQILVRKASLLSKMVTLQIDQGGYPERVRRFWNP